MLYVMMQLFVVEPSERSEFIGMSRSRVPEVGSLRFLHHKIWCLLHSHWCLPLQKVSPRTFEIVWNQIHASGWYRTWFFKNANSGFDEKHQRYQLVNPWSWVECINFILLEWILRTTNTICMNINAHPHFVWIKYKIHQYFSKYYYQLRQIIIWNLIDLIWKLFFGKRFFKIAGNEISWTVDSSTYKVFCLTPSEHKDPASYNPSSFSRKDDNLWYNYANLL